MELYKHSPRRERFIVQLGIFFSIAAGAVMPTFAIILGEIVKMFDPVVHIDVKREMMVDFSWKIAAICVATYVTTFFGYSLM